MGKACKHGVMHADAHFVKTSQIPSQIWSTTVLADRIWLLTLFYSQEAILYSGNHDSLSAKLICLLQLYTQVSKTTSNRKYDHRKQCVKPISIAVPRPKDRFFTKCYNKCHFCSRHHDGILNPDQTLDMLRLRAIPFEILRGRIESFNDPPPLYFPLCAKLYVPSDFAAPFIHSPEEVARHPRMSWEGKFTLDPFVYKTSNIFLMHHRLKQRRQNALDDGVLPSVKEFCTISSTTTNLSYVKI